MQLKKLEIKGFKSFGDKVTLNFNEGVTAIVGPNGCGKSNVVDAIRWVLGEQSTKMLRSEKMENIIFNGTSTRKSSSLAEVSLTFENNEGKLRSDFSTVTVTRKLFRSGDSEYRLNNVKCRLKDITELLLGTGLGADSYAIIELKMIDEIIANKDNSRRQLFEEAAGISIYKVRKKQSLQKLKETETDLSRVDDLMSEIRKNLKSLENQAKRAEKYEELKQDYRKVSVALANSRMLQLLSSLEVHYAKEKTLQHDMQRIESNISKAVSDLTKEKAEFETLDQNLSRQQKALHEHSLKLRDLESDKKLKNQQIENLEETIQRAKLQLQSHKDKCEQFLKDKEALVKTLEIEESVLISTQENLRKQEQVTEELDLQRKSYKSKTEVTTEEVNAKRKELFGLDKELAIKANQLESFQKNLLQLNLEIDGNTQDIGISESRLTALESELELNATQLQQELDFEANLATTIQDNKDKLQFCRNEISELNRNIDAKKNEYKLTKSLVDRLEGFPESIRFLKKHANWSQKYPLFSDILYCEEEYRVAIENFLQPIMNYYVVDDKNEAVKAVQLLRESSKGRAQFFILSEISSGTTHSYLPDESAPLIPALRIVEVDKKYKSLCAYLLKDVFVLLNDDDSGYTLGRLPDSVAILQKDGKFVSRKISFEGGSVGLFEGKRIGRAKNLEVLAKEINSLGFQLDRLKTLEEENLDKIADLERTSKKGYIEELKRQVSSQQVELNTYVSRRQQHLQQIESQKQRREALSASIRHTKVEINELSPKIGVLRSSLENAERATVDERLVLENLTEEFNELNISYNQLNIQFHHQKNKTELLTKELDLLQRQIQSEEQNIEKISSELSKAESALIQISAKEVLGEGQVSALQAEKNDLDKGFQSLDKEYNMSKKNIQNLDELIKDLQKQKDNSVVLLNDFREEITQHRIELKSIEERMSAEFQVSLDSDPSLQTILSEDERNDLDNEASSLKKRLDEFGVINSSAKESYDETLERSNFILEEQSDLRQSRKTLLKTIDEIDHTANEKFMTAFTSVRNNFVKVFRSLFNQEDACDLILTNPQRPLESDIDIIARPKGKKPLSINQLSGGEKTLTSTALLFSLYLLKPAPFCIFDEVDAPLDDTNIDKFNLIIRDFSEHSQFIIVSHNKRTIASSDIIYGVTMVEQGISKVVAVDLRDVA